MSQHQTTIQTHSRPPSTVDFDTHDPAEIWRNAIAANDDVCNKCYLRVKRTIPFPWKQGHRYKHKKGLLAFVNRHVPENADWEIAESTFWEQDTIPDRIDSGNPGDKMVACKHCNGEGGHETDRETEVIQQRATTWDPCEHCNGSGTRWQHGHGTYCRSCGAFDYHEPEPPRSIEDIRDVAFNVSMTLSEYDIAHDFVVLANRVVELKRTDLSGNDFQCFKRSVADAVRDARRTGADS